LKTNMTADEFGGVAMTKVRVGRRFHPTSVAQPRSGCQPRLL
jgi:hypothetical protein